MFKIVYDVVVHSLQHIHICLVSQLIACDDDMRGNNWSQTTWISFIHHVIADNALNSSPLDKLAAILAHGNFKCIFLNENDRIPIRVSLKFVARSPVDDKPALVQVMGCRQTGDKSLPELMLTQFTDAYMRH